VTGEVQNSNVSNAVRIPGTIEADRPQALDTVLTVNGTGGFAGSLDEGDTFVVRFNEVVTVAAGARLRVRDADTINSSADLVNGGNATFTLNTAAQTVNGVSGATGTVLTVRINTAPTVVAAGTTTGLQLPVTIVDSAGIVGRERQRLRAEHRGQPGPRDRGRRQRHHQRWRHCRHARRPPARACPPRW
jgi:hypothetical protein